jgi:Protein of unknown function (DUF2914)/Tetratricopeptide repeat
MATPADLQAIMDAAEQAAASNDFTSAARYLRDAAERQESTLGPAHPDLANTLNNLGVVCERLGHIDEAERSFRRAYAIATTLLPADHTFVATSRANLEEFCRLHNRSFEEPGTSTQQEPPVQPAIEDEADALRTDAGSKDPAYTVEAEPDPADTIDPAYERMNPERVAVPIAPTRGIPIGVIAVPVIAILIGIGWLAWPSRTASAPPQIETREATPPAVAPPTPAPPAPEPAAPTPTAPPPVDTTPAPPSTPPAPPPTSSDSPTVVDARVCRSLTTSGAWECDPVNGESGPGPVYFFTRVAATRETTVQHRWYIGDRLHQNVMLSIQPNGAGYRTYSRTTISPERAGEWRVELRTEDGRVLNEQRFTVR